MPIPADAAHVVLTNLPFGAQYHLQGSPIAWYRRTLAEAARVSPIVIVVAAPTQQFRQALGRLPLQLRGRYDLTIAGRQAAIWVLERTPRSPQQTRSNVV